jgi:hypothetical protein
MALLKEAALQAGLTAQADVQARSERPVLLKMRIPPLREAAQVSCHTAPYVL